MKHETPRKRLFSLKIFAYALGEFPVYLGKARLGKGKCEVLGRVKFISFFIFFYDGVPIGKFSIKVP